MSNRTQIPAEVDGVYRKTLLMRANPVLFHEVFCKDLAIESRAGSRIAKFRRWSALNPATTPLTEGVRPSAATQNTTMVTKTLDQYGSWLPFTDVIVTESPDPVVDELTQSLGDQMGLTRDTLARESQYSGTNLFYCGGKLSRVTLTETDNITDTVLDKVVENLKTNYAHKITPMIGASDKIGTSPVGTSYFGYCNQNGYRQLRACSSWVPVEKYSSTTDVFPGEIGKTADIRWIESNNGKVYAGAGASGIDVVGFVVFGKEAFGKVPLKDSEFDHIVHDLGSSGSADALNQQGSVGWKNTIGYLILNDAWVARIEAGKMA